MLRLTFAGLIIRSIDYDVQLFSNRVGHRHTH